MQHTLKDDSVTLMPGRYLIGDPCYNIIDEDWQPLLDQTDYFSRCHGTVSSEKGDILVVAFATQNGDGVYTDQSGNEYGVDSGQIGIISLEFLDEEDIDSESCRVVEFKSRFQCYRSGSVIVFGHVEIETGEEANTDDDDLDFGDLDNDY